MVCAGQAATRRQHAVSTPSARRQQKRSAARSCQHVVSTRPARGQHAVSTRSARGQHAASKWSAPAPGPCPPRSCCPSPSHRRSASCRTSGTCRVCVQKKYSEQQRIMMRGCALGRVSRSLSCDVSAAACRSLPPPRCPGVAAAKHTPRATRRCDVGGPERWRNLRRRLPAWDGVGVVAPPVVKVKPVDGLVA